MSMSYEIPAKSIADYEVIGLSREENKKFWTIEDKLNRRYLYGVVNGCLVVIAFVFDSQLFFVPFNVGPVHYALMQTVNVLWNTFGVFSYLHGSVYKSKKQIQIFLFNILLYTRSLQYFFS